MPIFPYSNINRSRTVRLANACEHCFAGLITEPYYTGGDGAQERVLAVEGRVPVEAEAVASWFFDGSTIAERLEPLEPRRRA